MSGCEICTSAAHVAMRSDNTGLVRMLCEACAHPRFADGSHQGNTTTDTALRADLERTQRQLQTAYVHLALVLELVRRIGGYMAPEDQSTVRNARDFAGGAA